MLLYARPLYAQVAVYQSSMMLGWLSPTHWVAFHFWARICVPVAML